jgi:hypothetical protein
MWIEEKGTSADPADMTVVCGCGKSLSLQQLFQPGRLGSCRGERPWLLDRDPNGCGQRLKLLTRTAANTYFPQVYTVISLPIEEDELTRLVDSVSGELTNVRSVQDMATAKRFNSKVAATLGAYSDDDLFARLQRLREGAMLRLVARQSCPNLMFLQAADRKLVTTVRPRNSTLRHCRATRGPFRPLG